MDQKTFEHEMYRAKAMQQVEHGKQDYWTGFQRGLRRGYHGEKFGTDAEHEQWWGMVDDEDRVDQGQGYRAGFRCGTLGPGYCSQNEYSCEICSLVNYGKDCHNNSI